jgi:hypothetical protein
MSIRSEYSIVKITLFAVLIAVVIGSLFFTLRPHTHGVLEIPLNVTLVCNYQSPGVTVYMHENSSKSVLDAYYTNGSLAANSTYNGSAFKACPILMSIKGNIEALVNNS